RICILSFSPIYRDGRVLRQIEYLAPYFDLTVIGYGPPPSGCPQVQWKSIAPQSNAFTKITGLALLVLGRLCRPFYNWWYWQKPHHRQALAAALESKPTALHANDWNTLPV